MPLESFLARKIRLYLFAIFSPHFVKVICTDLETTAWILELLNEAAN
jgi:hypothetical protein